MGFELPHPIVPGASPLVDDLDTVRRLEDAGAPMIVMHSLFEEQLTCEEINVTLAMESPKDSFAEALSYLPEPEEFNLGPDEYLDQVHKIKSAVAIPVIGSLNGTTEGGWLRYARLIEQAGADGLELNLYELSTDFAETGQDAECRQLEVIRAVKRLVQIPVAVKLSPFYSCIAHFAHQVDQIGIDGLVLFNRFYQPDVDVEQQELLRVNLSSPAELLLRLRWIGVLSGRVKASLAATGGVHTAVDVVKAVMVGAQATQMVSALLQHGPAYLGQVRSDLKRWLEEHEFESLGQMQGSMSLLRCSDPAAYQRANYIRLLQSWNVR
jgi:dihydroorotate dehydrogenase (fumarate)